MGCDRIMDRVWDWVLIWIEVLGWASMAWFRWEISHSDYAMFVVVVERWKRKFGGGWIVGFFFFFFFLVWLVVADSEVAKEEGCWGLDCVFFFSSSCCRSLWLWMVGQRWKWVLLLCYDCCCNGLVFGFGIYCYCCCCWSVLMLLLLLMIMGMR